MNSNPRILSTGNDHTPPFTRVSAKPVVSRGVLGVGEPGEGEPVEGAPRIDRAHGVRSGTPEDALRLRLAEAAGQVQDAGWLIELMQTMVASERFSNACHELTTQIQTRMNVVRVVVGWQDNRGRLKIESISGIADQDSDSEEVRLYQACLDESIVRGVIGVWPACEQAQTPPNVDAPSADTESMLSHQQIAGRDREAVSIPLITQAGQCVGSLLIIATRGQVSRQPHALRFLEALGPVIADVLAGSQRAEGTRFTRLARWYKSQTVVKRMVTAGLLCLAIAAAWIPMTYEVACSSVIEPVERRFAVAPHDGLLQRTKVQPGDLVEIGQEVAVMDGREVRWELAGLVAQHRRSAKQLDSYLADHKTSEALQAELEMQRLQSQMDLLSYRESNLTLKSPIAGIVLAGSIDHRENFPVDQGQVLYEIAPLDEFRIELSVATDEVNHITVGMPIEIQFAGFGAEVFMGTVETIRPQSEIRDGKNVFIAECLLRNPKGRLRPGMTGHAKIQADKQTVGWVVLHRAWEQVCMRLPW